MALTASHKSPLGHIAAQLIVRPKIRQIRTIAAFVLAPLTPGVVVLPLFVFEKLLWGMPPGAIFLLSVFYGYPLALVIGIPLYYLFMNKGWVNLWQVVLAGGFIGSLAPLGMLISFGIKMAGVFNTGDVGMRSADEGVLLLFFALIALGVAMGLICGLSFWLIALNQKTTAAD